MYFTGIFIKNCLGGCLAMFQTVSGLCEWGNNEDPKLHSFTVDFKRCLGGGFPIGDDHWDGCTIAFDQL